MKYSRHVGFLMFVPLALSLAACSPATPPPATAAPTATQAATFTDPFAYCAAVGTVDAPDARYTGPKVPESVAKGVMKASGASADAPLEMFVDNSFWRCADGKVYACTVGANLPCTAKADTNRTPTAEEVDFCKANPNSDVVPAVVTGRETVYEWRCKDGAPEIVRQVFKPDARGFISDFWYELSPN